MKFTAALAPNREFRRLYAKGKTAAGNNMTIYCRTNREKMNRLGITVTPKIGGAVVRNRVRRRLKEAYRLHERTFKKGYNLVLVARRRSTESSFSEMESELLALAGRLGLLENPQE